MFTVDAVIAEEERVFALVDAADTRARLDMRAADLAGLSADQARAIIAIAQSPYLVQPLQAPAGAGKTHSLQALRAAAHRTNKDVLVLAPTGKAVDEAIREDVGDRGFTVAKALQLLEASRLTLDRRSVVVVDEASMVGTAELRRLLDASTAAHAKLVLVGDAYQLAPRQRLRTAMPNSKGAGAVRVRSAGHNTTHRARTGSLQATRAGVGALHKTVAAKPSPQLAHEFTSAIGRWAKVVPAGEDRYGQIGKVIAICDADDEDGLDVVVEFPGDPSSYAFRRDELATASAPVVALSLPDLQGKHQQSGAK